MSQGRKGSKSTSSTKGTLTKPPQVNFAPRHLRYRMHRLVSPPARLALHQLLHFLICCLQATLNHSRLIGCALLCQAWSMGRQTSSFFNTAKQKCCCTSASLTNSVNGHVIKYNIRCCDTSGSRHRRTVCICRAGISWNEAPADALLGKPSRTSAY